MTLFALIPVRPPSARVEALSFRVVSRLQPSPRPGGLRTGFLTKPRLHFSSVPRGPLHRVSLESDLDTRPYLLLREGRHCGVCPACSASSTKNLFSLRVRIGSVEDDHPRASINIDSLIYQEASTDLKPGLKIRALSESRVTETRSPHNPQELAARNRCPSVANKLRPFRAGSRATPFRKSAHEIRSDAVRFAGATK